MLKIIYITDQYPVGEKNRNGMYIYRTVKELSNYYNVTVFALHPIIPPLLPMLKNISDFKKIYKEWKLKFPKIPKPPKDLKDVKVVYSKCFRFPRPKLLFTEAWGAYLIAKPKIKKLISNDTILHSNWIFPEGHLARIFSKKFNIPYVVTLRGSEFIYLEKHNLNGKFAQKIFDGAKRITAVANELRDQGIEKGIIIPKNKFSVLNDFYDFSIFEIRNKEAEKKKLNFDLAKINILFPGALRKIKNIYSILKSLLTLRLYYNSKIHLYIAGYGYEEENLKKFIKRNNLTDCVTFLGNLATESLVSYYNACDLICLPSYSEGFPTVIVEALLCGTPVVASNVGGIPEVIQDNYNGIIIDPKSVDSLIDGIKKCVNKNWNRSKLRESVSYLSKDKLIKVYEKLYHDVLTKSN